MLIECGHGFLKKVGKRQERHHIVTPFGFGPIAQGVNFGLLHRPFPTPHDKPEQVDFSYREVGLIQFDLDIRFVCAF